MKSSALVELDPARLRPAASEVDRMISDNTAFAAATGWRPCVSLDDGLRRTIAFYDSHRELLPPSGYVT
jgi:nucleoside-diphosphate-sugar epimerase